MIFESEGPYEFKRKTIEDDPLKFCISYRYSFQFLLESFALNKEQQFFIYPKQFLFI